MAYQSEIEKLEQRYRENPDQWFAALADSYRKAGSLDLALDVVRAGLEKRPNYVSGHIVLGRCLLQKPDDGAATEAFEKVLALDAENVIALKALSEIAERAGRVEDATRWLMRLLDVDPMNEDAEQALVRLQAAGAEPAAAEPAEAIEPAVGTVAAATTQVPAAPEPDTAAPAAGPDAPEEFVLEKSQEAAIGGTALAPFELERPAAQAASPVAPAPPEVPSAPVFGSEPQPLESDAAAGAAASEPSPLDEASPSAPVQPEAPAAPVPAPDLEPTAFEVPAAESLPPAEGIEKLAFEPPAPGETPPAPDLEPMEFAAPPEGSVEAGAASEAPIAGPFDDQLAWGTGERISGQISQDDIAQAEHAHEASLEPLVEMAGDEGPEAAGSGAASRAGSGDLPLIFPEEPSARGEEPVPEGEPPVGAEATPLVTETMAELYVKQGLLAEAREIYRTLVAQRPGDAALASRLAALEPAGAASRPARRAMTAVETGGASVRDFLAQVFPGALPAPPAPPPTLEPVREAPAAAPKAAEPTVADASGGEEEAGAAPPSGAAGAPTRRASDEMSLAAVFGEEPAPAAPRPPAAGGDTAKAGAGGGSFSFDEFFGGQGKPADGQPSTREAATRTEDDDDDFKRWLKGLKS